MHHAPHAVTEFPVAELSLPLDQGHRLVLRMEQAIGDALQEVGVAGGVRQAVVTGMGGGDQVREVKCLSLRQPGHGTRHGREQIAHQRGLQGLAGVVDVEHQGAVGLLADANVHGDLGCLGQAPLPLHGAL